jgi:hypothetical protein
LSYLPILNALVDTRRRVDELQVAEEVGAVLTLTRTAAQAITTAGTTITWQSALRNFQFTWSGSDITIPATGWYIVSIALTTSAPALNDLLYRINVNSANVQSFSGIGDADRQASSALFMRHFTQGDIVQISVLPSANVNINAVAENSAAESPILHIVQLSGGVG